MMNRKWSTYVIVIACFLSCTAAAQTSSVKDSVYSVICRVELENGRPEVGFILYKNLDSLPNLSVLANEHDAICTLLKNGVWFEEPFFTMANHRSEYGFSSKQEGDNFFDNLSQKIKLLSKRYVRLQSKKFADGKTIQIDCARFVGDFWLIDTKSHDINILNHSIKVEQGCYSRSFWYNLKNIDTSRKLSRKEIACVQAKIGK